MDSEFSMLCFHAKARLQLTTNTLLLKCHNIWSLNVATHRPAEFHISMSCCKFEQGLVIFELLLPPSASATLQCSSKDNQNIL